MCKIGMRHQSTFVRGEKCGVEYPCVGAQGVLVYDNVCGLCHCLGDSVFRMACRCAWVNRKLGCQDSFQWRHHYFDEALVYMKQTRENVGKQTCTLEECFMGKMKKIGVHTRGRDPIRNQSAILQRYILKMAGTGMQEMD